MSDRNRIYSLVLAFVLILTACSSAPGTATASPPSDPTPAAAILTPVASLQVSAETSAPKPKDLLFIEFFAIT